MKTLSLKLEDHIFEETEKVVSVLHISQNQYVNEALHFYNQYNKKNILKKKLFSESKLVAQSSMEILAEFEVLVDEG
ncbi:MAG: hypothetical protein ACOYKE_05220 [Ferruginibacter sp.]